MNANELADELVEWYEDYKGRFDLIDEAIVMLRKQQAVLIAEQEHNEMLEAELKAMREQLNANQV